MITSDKKNDAKLTTVIVVDDDHDIVDTFCEYLELKCVHVLGKGYNGKDAVELYQRFNPDVVFLDVMMPDYTGYYALEKIKQINPDAKIIMTTADRTEETENRLVELDASYVAYKPIMFYNPQIFRGKKE
jgi:two-component system chemotaxis response regulator CheY